MLDQLSQKLQKIFKNLRGEAKLSPEHLDQALREIRLALLEADVNFKVVKQFIESIKVKALGQAVLESLTPGQQVIKIVRDELVETLGGASPKLNFVLQAADRFSGGGAAGFGQDRPAPGSWRAG